MMPRRGSASNHYGNPTNRFSRNRGVQRQRSRIAANFDPWNTSLTPTSAAAAAPNFYGNASTYGNWSSMPTPSMLPMPFGAFPYMQLIHYRWIRGMSFPNSMDLILWCDGVVAITNFFFPASPSPSANMYAPNAAYDNQPMGQGLLPSIGLNSLPLSMPYEYEFNFQRHNPVDELPLSNFYESQWNQRSNPWSRQPGDEWTGNLQGQRSQPVLPDSTTSNQYPFSGQQNLLFGNTSFDGMISYQSNELYFNSQYSLADSNLYQFPHQRPSLARRMQEYGVWPEPPQDNVAIQTLEQLSRQRPIMTNNSQANAIPNDNQINSGIRVRQQLPRQLQRPLVNSNGSQGNSMPNVLQNNTAARNLQQLPFQRTPLAANSQALEIQRSTSNNLQNNTPAQLSQSSDQNNADTRAESLPAPNPAAATGSQNADVSPCKVKKNERSTEEPKARAQQAVAPQVSVPTVAVPPVAVPTVAVPPVAVPTVAVPQVSDASQSSTSLENEEPSGSLDVSSQTDAIPLPQRQNETPVRRQHPERRYYSESDLYTMSDRLLPLTRRDIDDPRFEFLMPPSHYNCVCAACFLERHGFVGRFNGPFSISDLDIPHIPELDDYTQDEEFDECEYHTNYFRTLPRPPGDGTA